MLCGLGLITWSLFISVTICKINVICLICTFRLRGFLARQAVVLSARHAEAHLSLLCSCTELAGCKQDQSWSHKGTFKQSYSWIITSHRYNSSCNLTEPSQGVHLCHVRWPPPVLEDSLTFLFLCTTSQSFAGSLYYWIQWLEKS